MKLRTDQEWGLTSGLIPLTVQFAEMTRTIDKRKKKVEIRFVRYIVATRSQQE